MTPALSFDSLAWINLDSSCTNLLFVNWILIFSLDSLSLSSFSCHTCHAKQATSGMHLGLDTIGKGLSPLPSPGSRRGSRRCSVVDIITQPSLITSGSATKSKSPKPGKKLFGKIGSEMVRLHECYVTKYRLCSVKRFARIWMILFSLTFSASNVCHF
jgi:hypothetical protein